MCNEYKNTGLFKDRTRLIEVILTALLVLATIANVIVFHQMNERNLSLQEDLLQLQEDMFNLQQLASYGNSIQSHNQPYKRIYG